MKWQMWAVNVIVLVLEGLLIALTADWITISNPVLATLTTTGLVLVLPGWLLLSLINKSANWAQKIGMACAVSLGMWSIPGLVLLSIHSNMKVMLSIIAGVTLTLGLLFVGRSIRAKCLPTLSSSGKELKRSLWSREVAVINGITLIVAISLIMSLYVSTVNIGHTDRRNYERYVRNYVESDSFLENMFIISEDTLLPARGTWSTWYLLVAALIKLTHLDLFDIYNFYLPPVLMILSYFSLYALGYELFKEHNTAWFATVLQTLYLSSGVFLKPEVGYGLKWLFRIHEDKFALWFMLLPGVLAVTRRYLLTGRKSWLFTVGICVFGIAVVHPMGLPYYAMAFGGYAILELIVFIAQAFHRRGIRQLVIRAIKHPLLLNILWVTVILGFLLIFPLMQKQAQTIVFAQRGRESRYYEVEEDRPGKFLRALGNNRYTVDPVVLNNSFIIAALFVTPWLVFRGFKSFTARFLAAGMIIPVLLGFTPVAPFVGKLITANLLWRLLWIMPVPLVLTFVLVDFVRWLQSHHSLAGRTCVSALLPLTVWLSALGLHSQIVAAAETLWEFYWRTGSSTPSSVSTNEYALFQYLHAHVQVGSTIFADEGINFNIPAMVGRAYGVTFSHYPPRLPQTRDDIKFFFGAPYISWRHLEILRLHDARYLVLPTSNPLYLQFASLGSAFTEIHRNKEWSVFELGPDWETNDIVHRVIVANDSFQKELYDDAARECERILAADRINSWASVMLGDIYRDQGLYQQAQLMYENAVRGRPDAETYVKLGDTYRQVGLFDLAEAQYRQAQELEPDYMPAWERLYWLAGDISRTNGNLELAVQNYRKATQLKQCGDPPEQRLNQRYLPPGWPLVFSPPVIKPSDWVSVCISHLPIFEFTTTYELNLEDVVTHLNLAYTYQIQGKTEQAVAEYEKVIAASPAEMWLHLHPYVVETYVTIGDQYFEQALLVEEREPYEKTIEAYRQAFALAPGDPEVRDALVKAYLAFGDRYFDQDLLSEMIAVYEKDIELDSDNVQAYWELAEVYQTLGRMDEAIAVYARVVAHWPDRAEAHFYLGQAYEARGRVEEALAHYQRILELEPDNIKAYHRLREIYRQYSELYIMQSGLDEAIALLHEASSRNPEVIWPHLELGYLYQEEGKLDEAIAEYEKVIELEPTFVEAYIQLGDLYKAQGRTGEAIAVYQAAAKRNPRAAWPHIEMGKVYLEEAGRDETD